MKVTVKKLVKMGLNKEQIKEILNISEEQYHKRYANNYRNDIENLPTILDFLNNGGNVSDYKMINIFDEIYNANRIEILGIDNAKKIELIKEFPNFIKYIEMKRITDQIKALDLEKEELKNKEQELTLKIDLLKTQFEMMNGVEKEEPQVETKQEKKAIPTFVVGESINIYYECANGDLHGYIVKFAHQGLTTGDYVNIATKNGMARYQISNTKNLARMQIFKLIEKIFSKGE